jgi:Uma2 family endonuclease
MSSFEFPIMGPILVLDPVAQKDFLAQRRSTGADRYDEVWEGVYVMSPLPSLEHQRIVRRLTIVFDQIVESLGKGEMFPGANLTDRVANWEVNFRCPDIVVVLDESRVNNLESAIVGGPEFLVEVASPGDRWPQKLDFYASIGVQELLVIDRDTREFELFRLIDKALSNVGSSIESSPVELTSEVLPLTFQLVYKGTKPRIAVRRNDGHPGSWMI